MKYFTSDDMKKSYHHCSTSIFLSELLIFNTHMHNTLRSIKSDSPPCLPASWSRLEEFWNFEDCTAFYIKIDNADPMLLLDLDQTPAKCLHLSRSSSLAFLDLFQFSISTQIILFSHKSIFIIFDKHISINFSSYC